MHKIQEVITRLFESRLASHITFLTGIFLFFLVMVALTDHPSKLVFNAVVIGIFDILCVYAGRWCARRLLADNQFLPFLLRMGVATTAMTFLAVAGDHFLMIGPRRSFGRYLTFNFPIAGALVVLGIFFTFTRASIIQRIKAAETAQRQKESELSLLLSQLRPHFLFNTLNNLYGLSLSEHEKLPKLLLKLSELLRYSLYETGAPFVPLRSEIQYLLNYIEFEQIRQGERMQVIENLSSIESGHWLVPPMILITFVENAVKHSKNTLHGGIVIDISAELVDETLCFAISNSIGSGELNAGQRASSGIGLAATIKRLDGLYGNDYKLDRYTRDNCYHVKIQMKVK